MRVADQSVECQARWIGSPGLVSRLSLSSLCFFVGDMLLVLLLAAESVRICVLLRHCGCGCVQFAKFGGSVWLLRKLRR